MSFQELMLRADAFSASLLDNAARDTRGIWRGFLSPLSRVLRKVLFKYIR